MEFKPGFRLSIMEFMFFVIMAAATWALMGVNGYCAWMAMFSAVMFFHFCNIFRIRRLPELVWATCYVVAGIVGYMMELSVWVVIGGLYALGLGIIAHEFKRPDYHGILWRSINPKLPEWFEKNITQQVAEGDAASRRPLT